MGKTVHRSIFNSLFQFGVIQSVIHSVIACAILFPTPGHTEEPSPQIIKAFQQGLGKDIHASLSIQTEEGTTIMSAEGLSRSCTLCDAITLIHEARQLGVDIGNKIRNRRPATLVIQELPPDALFFIDEIQLPAHTPSMVIEPGQHLLVLQRNHVTALLKATVSPGQTATAHLTDLSFSHLHRRLLISSIIASGVGLGLGFSGAALIAINNNCATPQVDADGNCTKLHDTRSSGIFLVSAGAAIIVTAIAMFIIRGIHLKRAKIKFFHHRKDTTDAPE